MRRAQALQAAASAKAWHRAQSKGQRAQSTGHRAPGTGRRVQGIADS